MESILDAINHIGANETEKPKKIFKTTVTEKDGSKWEELIYPDGTVKRKKIENNSEFQENILSGNTAPNPQKWTTWHGFRGDKNWPRPELVAACDEPVRVDQGNTIKANEFVDLPDVLDAKIDLLVRFLKESKFTVAYTGAGLSKSSGIPDYASKSKDSIVSAPKVKNPIDALPTKAHYALTSMEKSGYLHHYVQQNHDGLPQKSGFPQEKINEIHGAWFDPSNPVVQFGGSLRSDLFNWLMESESRVDLCLCLGTSLSGMNADRMAHTPANRAMETPPQALGTVVVNLQHTSLDPNCSIRIWAKLDDVFGILEKKLNLGEIKPIPRNILPEEDIFEIPYDEKGKKNEKCRMMWDLRKDAKVKIAVEGAVNFNALGDVLEKRNGHYQIFISEKSRMGFPEKVVRMMGSWWVDAALQGTVPRIPIVNVNPTVTKITKE